MSVKIETKARESNFELLRILSMFMIVIWHIGTHGIANYVELSDFISGYTELLYYFIRSLSVVAVSVYVMISGYFLSQSKFKISRLIRFFFEVSFFSIVIYLLNLFMGNIDFSILLLVDSLLSIFSNEYWFVTVYFVMYALSPFMNQLIDHMHQKMHFNLLLVLFMFFCIWQFIEKIEVLGVNGGFGLVYFLFLYFLGSYINKYKFITKKITAKTYLILYITIAVLNTLIFIYGTNYNPELFIFKHITRLYSYNSPLVLLMSYCIFQFFNNIKIQSSLINLTSKYVFGIYLIHDNPLIREILWKRVGIVEDVISSNNHIFLISLLKYSGLIFLYCWVISFAISITYNRIYKYIFKCFYLKYEQLSNGPITK